MENCKDCQVVECRRWLSNRPACSQFIQRQTCWDCMQRIGEECGIDGHEIYMDSKICNSFEECQ